MLTLHLFSRNIKTQYRFPIKWLNVTFNITKINLSGSFSSSSSSSDSDSDSDTESSNKNKLVNKDDTTKSTRLKYTDYLYAKTEKHKRREIDHQLRKVADMLTKVKNEKDKEKILSNILYTISAIDRQKEPSIIKQMLSEKLRNTEGQSSRRMKEEPSIIKQLQSKQQKLRNTEIQSSRRMEEEPSVIRQIQSEQQKLRNIESQSRTRMEEEPSVIRQIQSEQQKLKNIESQPRTRMEEEPSMIRQIQREQQKIRNIDNQPSTRMEEEPSIIKQLQSKSSQFRTKNAMEKAPSILKSLKNQQEERTVEYEAIFTNELTAVTPELKTWNMCEERELQMLMLQTPKNAFEELIKWTEEGKIWRFPIDNEQGLETEKHVHFSKHVFLEQHLAGWCPTKGPIRHFMELVCVGLSKNPYMTVQEKTNHIMWYKDYFGGKQDLLQKLGLIE